MPKWSENIHKRKDGRYIKDRDLAGRAIYKAVYGKSYTKVIDFEIVRVYDLMKDRDTCWLGTRGYAAPEQYSEAMVVEYNKKMKVGALHLSNLNTERNKKKKDNQKENEQLFSLLDSINLNNQEV